MSGARQRRGVALVLAMLLVVVISTLAFILSVTLIGAGRADHDGRARERLSIIAESGVEVALSRLRADRSWRGSSREEVPGGFCSVDVRPMESDGWRIVSTTDAEGRICALEVTAKNGTAGMLIVRWHAEYSRSHSLSR